MKPDERRSGERRRYEADRRSGVDTRPAEVAAHMAVMATLTALIARSEHGGQFVDVSILAAANTCAGPATVRWLSARSLAVPRRLSGQRQRQ